MSKCNICWEPLQGSSNVAPCGHIYCEAHAEAVLDQADGCPLCGAPVANTTLKVVPVEPAKAIVEAALRGLSPENIIAATKAGYEWWIEQTEMTYQEFMRRAAESAAGRETRIKAKLQEVHDAYKKVKSKSAVLTQEIAAVQTDRDELQKKYEAKSREKRQQDEHLSKLLAENQSLKANWRGPPGALQQHAAQHEAAVAAAAQAHAGGLPHGFGGGSMQLHGSGAPVMRSASLHQFSTHNAPGAAPGDALVTHTRSIHAASMHRIDFSAPPGGAPPSSGGGMPPPGRGFLPQHGADGGMSSMGFRASPAAPMYSGTPHALGGGSLGLFCGGGGAPAGGFRPGLQVPPSPQRLPRGAQHSGRFPM